MNILYWGLRLSVEAFKLVLIVFGIFGCEQVKNARSLKIKLIGILMISSFIMEQVNEAASDVIFISAVIIICFLLLQKKIQIIIAFFGFIAISIIDILIAGVVCLILGYSTDMVMSNRLMLFVLNSISLIILFVAAAIMQIRRKEKVDFQRKFDKGFMRSLLLAGVGLLCLIIYVVPIQYFSLLSTDEEARVSSLLGVTLSGIFFLVISISALVNRYAKERYQEENQIYKVIFQGQKDYYESMIERDKETRKLRHDMQQHFHLIDAYLEMGDIKLAKEYLENMMSRLENTSLVNTGNNILDIVIKDVWRDTGEIRLVWKGGFPEKTRIRDIDMCILFSNLLRNAIEATHQSEQEKKIEVHIKTIMKNIYIRVENPVDNPVEFKKKRPITTKADKIQHGLGTINIKDVVKSYNGHCEYKIDSRFAIEIILENVIL